MVIESFASYYGRWADNRPVSDDLLLPLATVSESAPGAPDRRDTARESKHY